MDQFDLASAAVTEALSQNRIGTLVAVRIVMLLAAEQKLLEAPLERTLDAAGNWLSSPATRLWAQGGVERGQLHVQLHFAGGQTALVTVGSSGESSPLFEVVVVGNRGTVSWEADGRQLFPSDRLTAEKTTELTNRWLPFVRESLRTGQAVVV